MPVMLSMQYRAMLTNTVSDFKEHSQFGQKKLTTQIGNRKQ